MTRIQSAPAAALATLTAFAFAAGLASIPSASAATRSLCGRYASVRVSGGAYIVENDGWGSAAPVCLRVFGGPAFTVRSSAIAKAVNGVPGAYPSAYAGCHWGACTSGGLAARPVRVSDLRAGTVTTSWSTVQPYRAGEAYDAAYDIWVSRTPRPGGAPRGSEIMIWLNHRGRVQPAGREVARNVRIGIRDYDIWSTGGAPGNTISYTLTSPHTSVSGLDIGKIIRNAAARGYTRPAWYLIDVEAGFELWHGGAGLTSRSFAVRVR